MARKLYRDPERGMIAGVCAGVADTFDIDVTIVRVIWMVLAFAASFGLLLYVACWIAFPRIDEL